MQARRSAAGHFRLYFLNINLFALCQIFDKLSIIIQWYFQTPGTTKNIRTIQNVGVHLRCKHTLEFLKVNSCVGCCDFLSVYDFCLLHPFVTLTESHVLSIWFSIAELWESLKLVLKCLTGPKFRFAFVLLFGGRGRRFSGDWFAVALWHSEIKIHKAFSIILSVSS